MAERERLLTNKFIAQEMRQAVLGSFPLSPGIRSGHWATLRSYWNFRQDFLKKATVSSVFATDDPDPIRLTIPHGHPSQVSAPEAFNKTIMRDMTRIAFIERPIINQREQCRELISGLVQLDVRYFEARLRREASHLSPNVPPRPSHLRWFLYEKGFPNKNEFFDWLLNGMRQELAQIAVTGKGLTEDWNHQMKQLIRLWSDYMPEPFFPKD